MGLTVAVKKRESPDSPAESQLIERARDGDAAAFGELYLRHGPGLFRHVLYPGTAGDRAVAEDLLQETFLNALQSIGDMRHPERGAYGWLRAIAVNALRGHWRRVGQSERGTRVLELLALDPTRSPPPDDCGSDEARDDGIRGRVTRTLSQLSDRYRTALTHRFVDGLDGASAADRLGVTRPTFDVILHRACKAFRKMYESQESQEES